MPGSLFFKIIVTVAAPDVEVGEGEVCEPDLVLEGKQQQPGLALDTASTLNSDEAKAKAIDSGADDTGVNSGLYQSKKPAGNQLPPWRQPRTVVETAVVKTAVAAANGNSTVHSSSMADGPVVKDSFLESEQEQKQKHSEAINLADNPVESAEYCVVRRPVNTGSYYPALKKRLVPVPTLSCHSRQSLYRDKYTGQFWLGLRANMGSSWKQPVEVLKPLGLEVAKSLTCKSFAGNSFAGKSNQAVKFLSSATMAGSVSSAISGQMSGRLLH